jgi:hypothetical protein
VLSGKLLRMATAMQALSKVSSIIHWRFLDHSQRGLQADHIRFRRTLLHADGPIEPFFRFWHLHAYLALSRDFDGPTIPCTQKPPPTLSAAARLEFEEASQQAHEVGFQTPADAEALRNAVVQYQCCL